MPVISPVAGLPIGFARVLVNMNDAEPAESRIERPDYCDLRAKSVMLAHGLCRAIVFAFLLYRFSGKIGLEMAQLLFILLSAAIAIYFVWRMKLDPMAVAFGSTLIYFTPGLFGVAQFSYGEGLPVYSQPMAVGAYGMMSLVMAAVAIGAYAVDRVPAGAPIALPFGDKVASVLIFFAIAAGVMSIRSTGVYYLCLDKAIVLDKLDPWYYYASLSAAFAVATAYCLRQWPIFVLGMVCLIADLYAGFRSAIAISFVACMMLSEDQLKQSWRKIITFAAVLVAGGGVLFMVKHLIVPAKMVTGSYCEAQLEIDRKLEADAKSAGLSKGKGGSPQTQQSAGGAPAKGSARVIVPMKENLERTVHNLSRPDFYVTAFVLQSEASVIQSTLNEVVRRDFKTGASYLVGQILTGLPLGYSVFGIDSSTVKSFNELFQPALFPKVPYSMANNPWAQAYAAGGLTMVAVFAAGYALVLGLISLLFNRSTGALKAALAVTGTWIAFYFHRNDLYIEAILIKHVVYISAASMLLAWLWHVLPPLVRGQRAQGKRIGSS